MANERGQVNELGKVDGDVFRCRCCGRSIGLIEGKNLHSGAALIVSPATMRCGTCNERNRWLPIEQPPHSAPETVVRAWENARPKP